MRAASARVAALLLLALCALAFGASACGEEQVPARELGERLFSDPAVSTSPYNRFSCATCHTVGTRLPELAANTPREGRRTPGYDLYGVVRRPSWWGGYVTRLRDAMNLCVTDFMGGGELAADDPRARQLFEYLAANGPSEPTPALPLTVVKNVTELRELTGDSARGRSAYQRACAVCHGESHTGEGRLGSRTSVIPEDTLATFGTSARAVVVEKVRHGRFFNIGGVMPLYSAEALSDQEIVDILAFLGL